MSRPPLHSSKSQQTCWCPRWCKSHRHFHWRWCYTACRPRGNWWGRYVPAGEPLYQCMTAPAMSTNKKGKKAGRKRKRGKKEKHTATITQRSFTCTRSLLQHWPEKDKKLHGRLYLRCVGQFPKGNNTRFSSTDQHLTIGHTLTTRNLRNARKCTQKEGETSQLIPHKVIFVLSTKYS